MIPPMISNVDAATRPITTGPLRKTDSPPRGAHQWRLLVSLLLVCGSVAESQVPAARTLSPPRHQLAEEFSEIISVRELPNEALLIADRLEGRIVSAHIRSGAVNAVGRRGQGPGEYGNVFPIYNLGADSSLMADLAARRWLIFNGERIGRTIPSDHPAFLAARGRIISADTSGNLLARAPMLLDRPVPTDSLELIRILMSSGAEEVVGRLRVPPTQIRTQGNIEGRPERIQMTFTVMGTGEDAVLFPDGWLAIARLEPYRIDWRSPDGRLIRGPTLPFRPIPFDAREKQAYRDRLSALRGRPDRTPDNANWPSTVPPFVEGALLPLPDGRLLVARVPTADHPENNYDVVDRRGRLVSRLVLPANERIVGVGRQSLYVAVTREDGLQILRQHPWP